MTLIAQCAAAVVAVFPKNLTVTVAQGTYSLRVMMVAIAGQESSWNPNAAGDCGLTGSSCGECTYGGSGATSWGLWQIHNSNHVYLTQQSGSSNPCTWQKWLSNPTNNARAAYQIYQSQKLNAWSTTMNSGGYAKYLAQAQSAVQAAEVASSSSVSHRVKKEPAILVPIALLVLGVLGLGGDEAWRMHDKTGHY